MLLDFIIHANVPFSFVDNEFFIKFLEHAVPSYIPPSSDLIRGRLLNEKFTKHFSKKIEIMENLKNVTLTIDGWTDVSGNSIYGFLALTNEEVSFLSIYYYLNID